MTIQVLCDEGKRLQRLEFAKAEFPCWEEVLHVLSQALAHAAEQREQVLCRRVAEQTTERLTRENDCHVARAHNSATVWEKQCHELEARLAAKAEKAKKKKPVRARGKKKKK